MTPLCTLKNLTLTYPHKLIFKDVTFTLNEGDKIGVLGLNGHGKSSLFKILNEDIKADTTTPPFVYDKSRGFSLFMVPQELPTLNNLTIDQFVYEFYPEIKLAKKELNQIEHDLTHSIGDLDTLIERQAELYEVLNKLGEESLYNQYINYLKVFGLDNLDVPVKGLSGGEQRKIALSLGLSAPHNIILWDEPTNHLDLQTIEKFEAELSNSKKTFMIISHDRALLNNVVERIIHIQHGKLRTFKGTYFEYLEYLKEEQKNRAKEIDKLTNYKRRETAWIQRGVSARRTKSKKRIDDYSTLNQKIQDLKALSHKQVDLDLKSSQRKTKVLFEASEFSLAFNDLSLLEDFNFKICKGDKIALMGNNGAGKSSLLNVIMGNLAATKGNIKKSESLNIGYFSQKRESLSNDITPWDLIGEGIDFVISNSGEKKHVASYLENFLFSSEEIRRPISTFSGGEKNRLQLAQFMKHEMDLWIFDEPTNDLDLETIGILEEELKSYQGALILVCHDRTFIENVTNKCWLIHEKKLEQFEAGFSQAALFLEALDLEEELNKSTKEKKKEKSNQSIEKLTFKEKQRLEQIPDDIEKKESEIEKLKHSLSKIDFNNLSTEDSKKLRDFESQLKKAEAKLESLVEEWAFLEEKSATT